MYYLFPKFLKILTKDKYTTKNINLWAMIMALLYSFIPFYAYRVSQFHLFYMSIFYPIHIYLFLKLLNSKKFDIKTISIFVISMFFGLTSPNIIVFELISFVILFLVHIVSKKFSWKKIRINILNLVIAAIGVILSSLYWLIPYILMGSPQPGYVINDHMIDMLSQGTSLVNFILGQADWFVGQGDLGVLDSQSASLNIIQIIGCILLYFIAVFTLIKYIKKKYAIFIAILLLLTSFLVLDFMPYHNEVFQFLIYSPIGWVLREINRISFFWYFWIYIAFALGTYRLYQSILNDKDQTKLLKIIFLPAIIIPFFVYILPINVKIFKYLKPIEIDQTIEEIFTHLESDPEYFSVYYFPRVDYYSIPWLEEKFEIADSEEYKWLTYNSPKPPVYLSTVIPNAKTPQALFTEYIFEESEHIDNLGNLLQNVGVKYIVIRKAAKPINLSEDYIRANIIYPMYYDLQRNPDFSITLENDYYVLFENNNFRGVVNSSDNTLYSLSSFNMVEHLPEEIINNLNIRFCNIEQNWDSCFGNTSEKKYLKYEDEEYSYLSLLTREEKIENGIYPYDYTYNYGINSDWARASFYDAINGELHNIFRRYDIHAWDFDVVDKVAYSDSSYIEHTEEDINSVSELSFTSELSCEGNCIIFANVLFNHIGGDINISVNNLTKELSTESMFERFKWVKLGELNLQNGENINITLESENSFNALGGILILPEEKVEQLEKKFRTLDVAEVPPEGILRDYTLTDTDSRCQFETTGFRSLNVDVVPNEYCEDKDSLYLTNHNYELLVQDKDQTSIDVDSFEQGNEYRVILTSFSDFYILFGAIITLILMIIILAIIIF
jgi:hypothetical protein